MEGLNIVGGVGEEYLLPGCLSPLYHRYLRQVEEAVLFDKFIGEFEANRLHRMFVSVVITSKVIGIGKDFLHCPSIV